MIHTVVESKETGFVWLDISSPKPSELEDIAKRFALHPEAVKDCLDPRHLPKLERFGSILFLIARSYDDRCSKDADSIQEMTRKIAVFLGPNFLITVHRRDQKFLEGLRAKWTLVTPERTLSGPMLFFDLLLESFQTYAEPLDLANLELEKLEIGTFHDHDARQVIQKGYFLKRRASVFKRMIRLSLDILPKLTQSHDEYIPHVQNIRETVERLYFYADELLDNTNALLNMHFSLESRRVNEIIRVLTVFSVFFMPLNFIAGIYGMNFEQMPELKSEIGYPVVLASMVAVCVAIYTWFRRKGWLR